MTVEDALQTLTASLSSPNIEASVRARWAPIVTPDPSLDPAIASAADVLTRELPPLTSSDEGLGQLAPLLKGPHAQTVLVWCAASSWRGDVQVGPVLALAWATPGLADRIAATATERVIAGPMLDALACAPFVGSGETLQGLEHEQTRARLEILIWEAGASAQQLPGLGQWLFGARSTFALLIHRPSLGTLRGRVLAARGLEIAAMGLPSDADEEIIGSTLEVLQPLLLHPEPMVWVHAARALGRLTGVLERLHGMLLDWVGGHSEILRCRAITAMASLPADALGFLGSHLRGIVLSTTEEEPEVLAALAHATPYLFRERYPLWRKLADRILAGEGGPHAAGALAQGLATLWRQGETGSEVTQPMLTLRELARLPRQTTVDELRGWIEVTAATDVIDGAERDPLDLERGLDNLTRIAAQYDDEEADARAARFAGSLSTTLSEAKRIALGDGRPRHRAAAMNAWVACARAFATQLWTPLLATHAGEGMSEPDLTAAWEQLVQAPTEILDVVRGRRRDQGVELPVDVPLEVLALRLGGHALDACDERAHSERSRGPTAHLTCLWLRKLEGLADGSRDLPPQLEAALSELFWRLVDSTRGTTLGVDDDVEWLGPFAAWWGAVIDRPDVLRRVATALPMMVDEALEHCCAQAKVLRDTLAAGPRDPEWSVHAAGALRALKADKTELAHALSGLASALQNFRGAVGRTPGVDALCVELVMAADRLVRALGDPVKALRPAKPEGPDSLAPGASLNAPRVAGLVARAIATRDPSMVEVWLASLGPIASALADAAIRAAIARTPPLPPKTKKEPKVIEGYELLKPLGEGGVGSVWLVRKPGADRMFVLKIPKAEALASASDTEREGILASFVEEAAALAGLYHPNVANIIDRGVAQDIPFLVLELLIGADLKQYSAARRMTLFELRQVVLDTCAGLTALHNAGLVHRDIKPANLWLRLPLTGGERFDPQRHRDPAVATPLSTVVIDFGMVRAAKVAPEAGGRFVAGTAGYIAPEQVLDPVELDARADVYALAATVYNVTTGRSFFDEIESYRDRIVAHMQRDPFDDPERLRGFPTAVARLLRAASARNPEDRPSPLEFGRLYVDAL